MEHKHSVYDTDPHFLVDEHTREITYTGKELPKIVQHDHNSEIFTIRLPKVIDGHNMMLCNDVRVNYINIDSSTRDTSKGPYKVKDVTECADDKNMIACSWKVSGNATMYAGTLSFMMVFMCTDDNGNITYRWNTLTNSNLIVGSGMDNGEEIIEQYTDIIAQWENSLFGIGDTEEQRIKDASAAEQAAIAEKGVAVLDSIPADYSVLSALADQNRRNKAGAIVLDAAGESIVLNDASEHPVTGLKVLGKSTQDGTPTPDAPVEIVSVENPAVTVVGKNLWDEETELGYWQSTNGEPYTANNQIRSKNFIPIIPNATIYVIAPNNKMIDFVFYDKNKSFLFSKSLEREITSPTEAYFLHINLRSDYGTTYHNDVCVSLRPLNGAYEPHAEKQTIDFAHTLPGIPVSSGGNYTDANGQQWICDEVDLARGVYVQRILQMSISDFSGAVTAEPTNGHTEGYLNLKVHSRDKTGGYCDKFPYAASGYFPRFGLAGAMIYFTLEGEYTQEEWKARMSVLSPSIITALKEPIETPLSDAEINAYKALCTNKPNTTILNDAGAYMAVEYVADTKTYIDNKIAELMAK